MANKTTFNMPSIDEIVKDKAMQQARELDALINDMVDSLSKVSDGKNLSKYWKTQDELIQDVIKSQKEFNREVNNVNASNLLKVVNALKAIHGNDISDIIPDFSGFEKSMQAAKNMIGSLDSAFDVKSFERTFASFEGLKAYGLDLESFFKHFELDIDTQRLRESLQIAEDATNELRRELHSTQAELTSKKIELDSFIDGSGLTEQIEKLKKLEDEIERIRKNASREFKTFLRANDFVGQDLDEDGQFYKYFDDIKNGTLSARQAIANFKSEYGHLLQENYNQSGGLFNIQQIQAFENKLETVLSRVEEISRQMNNIVENGVMTKAMQNLSVDDTISQSQRDLFANVLKDEEALSSIAGVLKKIIDESVTLQGVNNKTFDEEQFNRLLILFEKIESSLSSMKAVFVDVGDGEEFSPLLKMINNVQESIEKLSTSVKGIGLNMNIDVGSDKELETQFQDKISKALIAYQRLFDHIKMSGVGGSVINDAFFNFDLNQFDTTIGKVKGLQQFIDKTRDDAKALYGGQDVLKQDTDAKFWNQASAALAQIKIVEKKIKVSTDTSPLENLFGKTDLTEVVTQLNLIVDKLGEISTTASEFKNVFANGFNVSASVEEIEKLTSRVKELEDELSKVKVYSTSPVETNISSGNSNIENELKLLQDKKKILSSLQEEYDEEEISEMSQIKSYQEILRLVTKIRDLKLDNTMAKGKASGARQINDSELAKQYEDEASAIRKEINTIEDAIPLLIAFEDLTKKTISSFTTNDELNNFAIELYQCLVNLRGELGLINSEDFSKVSAEINTLKESVIKIPDKKKVEIELEYKSVTPNGELVYRGIAGKDGNYLNVSNDDGAVWWTSQKDLSQTRYTRNGTGSEFSGNLKAKNLFEFVSASTNWQKATNLGDGSDELSIKITDLYNKIEILKSKKEELIKTNQIESQEYKNISIELGSLESQYDAISKSKSNMYGTHMPNDWVKIAKKNGYDGLAIHNIDDDTNGLATSYAVWAKEQIENVKIVADTEEDFIRIHNEFLESASSTPIKDTFQGETEASEMGKVATAVDEAIQAKKDFATANEGVQASVDGSKSKLELETELMERLAKSAREAADAKKEFVEANKQVQGSVGDTRKSVKKDKYKNKSKISEDEYTGKSDYYASIANQKLKNSGNTILGETVSTELVDGLVKVTAKIKTADDTWKTFSAKIDADGNMFEQRFRTITKGVDKLETELKNFGLDTNPALSYGETLKKAEEIRSSLKLDDSYTIKVDSNELVTITQKLSDVKSSTTSVTQTFKSAQDAIEHFGKEASSSAEKTTVALKGVKASAESIGEAVGESLNFESIDKSLDKYNDKLRNFTVKPADGHRYPIYQKNIDDLTEKVSKLQTIRDNLSKKDINLISKEDIDEVNTLEKDIDELIFKMSKMSASEKGFDPLGADKALEKINSELKKNSAMSKEAKRQIQGFYDEIRSGNPSKPIKDLLNDMYKLIQAERLAGREGKSFMDIFKEKVVYGAAANLAGMIGIYDIINAGREGITVIRELDTALTEMRKVSDETVSSLERFQDVSFDLADDVGTTAKQIQNSTADYMRLGESLDEATESARVANILLNVSEFDNIDDATSSLVSMGQAYKDLDKIEIVDKLNEVGNSYAISTDELAVAMQKSAATLSLMGNSIDETASMITTANSVLQDADTVSAGLRTISLRIVGTEQAEEQLEAMNEEIDAFVTQTNAKKQQIIKDYTAVASNNYKGFDILDENGNYKSTYDILLGISKIYKEIQEEDKKLGTNRAVALVEELAGKNRSNVASAILSDPAQLEAVKKSSEEAFGSAQEELDKFLESIDGRMAKLENQAQEFWYKLIDSDTIKNGITLLTELLGLATDFVDTFGALGTAGVGIGAYLGIKNVGINMLVAY